MNISALNPDLCVSVDSQPTNPSLQHGVRFLASPECSGKVHSLPWSETATLMKGITISYWFVFRCILSYPCMLIIHNQATIHTSFEIHEYNFYLGDAWIESESERWLFWEASWIYWVLDGECRELGYGLLLPHHLQLTIHPTVSSAYRLRWRQRI
jgi:hypothetical protein